MTRDDGFRERKTGWGLAAISMAAILDASFLPCPVTTLFVVMSLTRPSNTAAFAVIAIVGTLIGAGAGFLAGKYLWVDNTGEFTRFALFCLRTIPGFTSESYARLSELYNTWGVGLVFLASCTAVPFGVMSVSAGLFDLQPGVFLLTTFIGQTAKYVILAVLCRRFGPQALRILKFNWKPWVISAALLFASFAFILKIANN